MTKKLSTKRALIASVLSLVLCFSMLVGTTFAWFTDSVTSANNIIKSGNLDVELYYQAEGQTDWTKVTDTTNVFKENALWEPGHTEVVKLKVVNEGTLALKYQLGINIASETGSVNVNEKEFELSDFIKYGIVDGAQTYTRDQAIAAVNANATTLKSAYNSGTTSLDAKNDSDSDEKIVTMVVYMPTTVGNDANAKKDAAVPTINLGINLFATQLTSENDSFDNTYDQNAWHPDFVVTNSDELKVALTNGGNVALANDVIISESLPVTKDTVLDLNGKNIGTSGSTTGSPLYLQGGKLTVKNGTLDLDGLHTNVNGTFSTAIGYDAQTELVVENVSFTGTTAINGTFATDGPLKIAISDCTMDVTNLGIAVSANSTEAIATINNCNIDADVYAIFASQGSKITINGGTYKSAGKVITSMYDNTVVTINGGTFDGELWVTSGGSLVIYGGTFTADPSAYVANGYIATKNADGTYTVVKGATVADAADLKDALAAGGNIVLTEDIAITNTLMTNEDAVIDLNGNAITAPANGNMFHSGSDNEPSILITSSTAGAEINVSGGDVSVLLGYGSTVIENVTINITGCDNQSPNPFKVYGDLTIGEGTVVNIDYLGTALISNSGAVNIVIDGAEINIGTFKRNGVMIDLNNATTFEMKNTTMKIDNYVLSQFGGEGLIKKIDGVTIENCTFDITDSNGASCTFVADAGLGRYDLVQK